MAADRVSDPTTTPAPKPPQVLVRTFATPPGMPWDQSRAAQLEARHGSPLPIADLLYRVRRLRPWAPGAASSYAVLYVRKADFSQPFETTVEVDGVELRVGFGSPAEQMRRMAGAARLAAAVVGVLAIVGLPVAAAVGARNDAEQRLAVLEARIGARLRQAQRLEHEQALSAALTRARGASAAPADVVADLAWLSRAKTPDARIVAVHWDHGVMAIEARGDAAPIAPQERQVVRAPKPLRPGISLWGVSGATARAEGRATSAPAGGQ